MANKFTRFLTGVGEGLLTPKGQLANWQHATRLFIDDTMRLAPRTKFMFYVRFEIDKTLLKVSLSLVRSIILGTLSYLNLVKIFIYDENDFILNIRALKSSENYFLLYKINYFKKLINLK
jgi:hypothetical protein